MEKLLHVVQTVGLMCNEALFVPPTYFAFVTGSLTSTTRQLDFSAFREEDLTCAAMSGLLAYISEKRIPIQRLGLEYLGPCIWVEGPA